jgi:hypothetical protein
MPILLCATNRKWVAVRVEWTVQAVVAFDWTLWNFEVFVTFPSDSSGVLFKTRYVEDRNVTNRGGSRPAARNWRPRWNMHFPPTPSTGLILAEISLGQMNTSDLFLCNAFYWNIIIWFVHPTAVSEITWTSSTVWMWCPRRPPSLPVWMSRPWLGMSTLDVKFRVAVSKRISNSKIKDFLCFLNHQY